MENIVSWRVFPPPMMLVQKTKLERIKELIEWNGIYGELYGSNLQEVDKLVCEMLGVPPLKLE